MLDMVRDVLLVTFHLQYEELREYLRNKKGAINKSALRLDHMQKNIQKQMKSSIVRQQGDGMEAVVRDVIQGLL